MPSFTERVKNGWNAFFNNRDPTRYDAWPSQRYYENIGSGNSNRPDRHLLTRGNERSFITAILNRLAVDIASNEIEHVKLDENNRYADTIEDALNDIFNFSANLDQTGFDFKLDIFLSLFDEGCVALVPTDTDVDPETGAFKPLTARVGKIVEWFPEHVCVNVYNEKTGIKQDIILPKTTCCIVQNPFYSIMNEPNSTFKRLVRKLNLLDILDGQSSSGKLDLIVQLPYAIKSEARRAQADQRKKDIEIQLSSSKYGIAYIDSTEHITQLNRSIENNILPQIEYLTKQLMSQIGMTEEIMNGTANPEAMTNYQTRICEPCLNAVVSEVRRKWISKTARSQKHTLHYYNNPFKLIPVDKIADISDKMTRNEILSSNEVRGIIGYKPSKQEGADDLRNKNLNQSDMELGKKKISDIPDKTKEEEINQNGKKT